MLDKKKVIEMAQELDRIYFSNEPKDIERKEELFEILGGDNARVFKCAECGEMCVCFDFDFEDLNANNPNLICNMCYERLMGEDL